MDLNADYQSLLEYIEKIDPIKYCKTRNYLNGAVTRLSPYISRGVISTKYLFESVLNRGFAPEDIEQYLKELAWRDYFQLVWLNKGELINTDLKQAQQNVNNWAISKTLIDGKTGIKAIDNAIKSLYTTGYIHNHERMYLASTVCNIGQSHWYKPAQWMYYHLLDADWASNACSWQWVAGSNSSKKYFANQENINRYTGINQYDTFLDTSYDNLALMDIPNVLKETSTPILKTELPLATAQIDPTKEIFIYNFYNLDPIWAQNIAANRVLLLEPSFFEKYPSSPKVVDFIINIADQIPGIQTHVAEFGLFKKANPTAKIHYKEHPTTQHYEGVKHQRDWIFDSIKGYYPSFFSFWNVAKKQIGLK